MNRKYPTKKTIAEAVILIVLVCIFLFFRFASVHETQRSENQAAVKTQTQEQTKSSTESKTAQKKSYPMNKKNLIGKTFYHGKQSLQFVDDHRLISDSPDQQTSVLEYKISGSTITVTDGSTGNSSSESIRFLSNGFVLGKDSFTLKKE